MSENQELNLGPQPIGLLLERYGLKAHDLVEASTEQITHKMVSRAVKGRRLTARVKGKIVTAFNKAAPTPHPPSELFTY